MSYLDKHLMSGERVVHRSSLHWTTYRWAILFAVFSLTLIPAGKDAAGAVGAFMVLAVAIGLAAYVRRSSSEFGVTNKRVIIKVGLLRTRSIETLLSKVEAIEVEQSLLGRMLGYGTIIVSGTGGTKEPFKRIEAPLDFRRHVQEQTTAAPAPVPVAR
jgi:uncharacterized membrane protein YdbT with pleckstrin-like domain